MNDVNERTEFEKLPPEIIHLICDYLSGQNVIRAFLSLNRRLNGIIGGVRLHTVDLSQYTRRELTNFMKTTLPLVSKFSESFTLSNSDGNEDHCSANIEFVFSSLIDPNDLYSHWNHLQQITFIRPLVDLMICLPDLFLQSFFLYPSRSRITLRKSISATRIPVLMICGLEVLRSSLANHGGLYDQVLVDYRNATVNSLIPRVRHLKLHIDNYEQQWDWMSPLINASLMELTVILQDNRFTDYYGHMFSSLVEKISVQCRLHFFLQVCSIQLNVHTDIDNLLQSFQSDFYTQHQSNVTIAYCRYASQFGNRPLMIYTSPLCISKLTLVENQETVGFETDITNLTQLTFDPCLSTYTGMFSPTRQRDLVLPNLRSLELISSAGSYFTQHGIPQMSLLRDRAIQPRHVHFNRYKYSPMALENIPLLDSARSLRYLDVTDDSPRCSVLEGILQKHSLCHVILHLNITGGCRLTTAQMQDVSRRFTRLQTLRFTLTFSSSFTGQLDVICQSFVNGMETHLRYLHVDFEQDTLPIMSLIPSENQLSEWLGHNQRRLTRVQAVELNRKEFFVWM